MEDFGYTLVRTSAIKDMECRRRKKRVQPTDGFRSVVLQLKTYGLGRSCGTLDFDKPSIVGFTTKENLGTVGLNSQGGLQ